MMQAQRSNTLLVALATQDVLQNISTRIVFEQVQVNFFIKKVCYSRDGYNTDHFWTQMVILDLFRFCYPASGKKLQDEKEWPKRLFSKSYWYNYLCCHRSILTNLSLASLLWDIGKQHGPRCDAAECGVPSGAILFA